MGGLLKVEAKNYMETKKKYDEEFRLVNNLGDSNSEYEKHFSKVLSLSDVKFFESSEGLIQILLLFIRKMR